METRTNPESSDGEFDAGVEIELKTTRLRNISLGQLPRDDSRVSEQEAQLQLQYRSGSRFSALGQITRISEQKDYADTRPDRDQTEWERGEFWAHFARLFDSDFALRVGRQNFVEPRRWWWDDERDAVRLYYSRDPVRAYIGVAEELMRQSSRDPFIDRDEDGVRRVLGHANWRFAESFTLGVFYLGQRDTSRRPAVDSIVRVEHEDDSDATLRWTGLRASGSVGLPVGGDISYWADSVVVRGDETVFEYEDDAPGTSIVDSRQKRRVHGRAIDIGITGASDLWGKPTLTLSYARGSGDKHPDVGTDYSFRQTGLEDRDEEFRAYGELLRPELSNLTVHTIAFGLSVHARTRVTLGHHRFRQVYPLPFLRESRLDADPTGLSTDVGSENRLLIEIREWKDIEIDVAAATFTAGKAFGVDDGARAKSLFGKFTFKF